MQKNLHLFRINVIYYTIVLNTLNLTGVFLVKKNTNEVLRVNL
jgi:hypothetical protein